MSDFLPNFTVNGYYFAEIQIQKVSVKKAYGRKKQKSQKTGCSSASISKSVFASVDSELIMTTAEHLKEVCAVYQLHVLSGDNF